ncbi:MAG: NADH-quinone oxidoreductase subunit NuoB [Planctomycetota bacterium]
MALTPAPGGGAPFPTRAARLLEALKGGLRVRAFAPLFVGAGCCAADHEHFASLAAAPSSLLESLRHAPRDADLLVVAGVLTHKMAPMVERVWRQMPEPRSVIAWGNCAVSGGAYAGYSVPGGLDLVLPVDLVVPGCPPSDEALRAALETLLACRRASRGRGR